MSKKLQILLTHDAFKSLTCIPPSRKQYSALVPLPKHLNVNLPVCCLYVQRGNPSLYSDLSPYWEQHMWKGTN